MLDGSGSARNRFVPGDSVVVEVDLEGHKPTDEWGAGIAIFNKDDVLMYGTNSYVQLMTLAPFNGGHKKVRFVFDDIALAEGQYYCTVAVHPHAPARSTTGSSARRRSASTRPRTTRACST